jgi:hypothetical protein
MDDLTSRDAPYRAAEMDDVLLQAMWRRPRGCLRELMQNARTKAAAGGYQKSVAEVRVLKMVWRWCCLVYPALLVDGSLFTGTTAVGLPKDPCCAYGCTLFF